MFVILSKQISLVENKNDINYISLVLFFPHIMNYQLLPREKDPIFMRLDRFRADKHPAKVNLGIGIYSDEAGNPFVPESIQQAAKNIDTRNFNYVSMQGDITFLEHLKNFILGDTHSPIAVQQSAGGTHAIRLAGKLLASQKVHQFIWGTPSWGNYKNILDVKKHIDFDHLDAAGDINFSAYKQALETAQDPENTLFLLQGAQTHNQTGKNLSMEQLQELVPIIKERNMWTLIDAAYIGLGEGFKADLAPIRYLFESLDKVMVAVSFSKNASLYRQRLGGVLIKTKNEAQKNLVETDLQVQIRRTISNPPAFGAMIMGDIFENNLSGWMQDVDQMRASVEIRKMKLINGLNGKMDYLKDCRGMFGIVQASEKKIETLVRDHGVYILPSGRINFSGIPMQSMGHLIESFDAVL